MTPGPNRRGGALEVGSPSVARVVGAGRTLIDSVSDLAGSNDHLDTMRRSARLAAEARRAPDAASLAVGLEALARRDALACAIAVEVLGAVDHPNAGRSLTALPSAPNS